MISKLSISLISIGFVQSKFDHSLFIKKLKILSLCFLVYVDDIIIAENSISDIGSIKKFLDRTFKIKEKFLDRTFRIKDLGKLNYFLGLEMA